MATEFEVLVRPDIVEQPSLARELSEVRLVADRLRSHMNEPGIVEKLAATNQPKRGSKEIEHLILDFAKDLGFTNEQKGLFAGCKTRNLRPDYFKPMGDTGILLEVERGKTVANNMDLLDFWKCHLCEHAHYLFLVVPTRLKHSEAGSTTHAFRYVMTRLSSFFQPRNVTNVRAVFLFGY